MDNKLEVLGKITKVSNKVTGISKKTNKGWVKQDFVVKTADDYNNIFPFTIFGEEKVETFNKYNKVGDTVKVSFNVNANEYEGKYFTNLNAWSIFKEGNAESNSTKTVEEDDLPF